MQAYRITRGQGIASLALASAPARPLLAADEVRVRIHAVALNYRDLLVADGRMGSGAQLIPGSEAAGQVVEVGVGVTRFQPGDRVMPLFFPDWLDGFPEGSRAGRSLGGNTDGVLAGEFVGSEQSFAAIPAHMSYEEAATIPCTGLTAWHALRIDPGLRAGSRVLVLGTGGVSVWALQLAKSMGMQVAVTSSDDAKLDRARKLGADATVNYRTEPEWDREVVRQGGADLVVEIGGQDTIARSLAATRPGGTVALVGGVGGGFGVTLDPFALAAGKRLAGVLVGSRAMAGDLVAYASQVQLRPVVDRVFAFGQAREAYEYLQSGRHFGKVVVNVA